jgi:simple sugar transport system permease protein
METGVFCGFCAGTAGLIICSNVKSADPGSAGLNMELDAVLASVIGGTRMAGGKFSLFGSLIGALLVQTLATTVYAFGVPPEAALLFKALAVVLVCFLQSGAAAMLAKRAKRAAS